MSIGKKTTSGKGSVIGKRVVAVVAAMVLLALTFCLVACGGGSSSSGGSNVKSVSEFTGKKAEDAKGLEDSVEYAISWGENIKKAAEKKTADEIKELENSVAFTFAEGNSLYRSGDYNGAESAYKKVLDEHPTHFGANVNVVLALLQKDYNSEALNDALKCVYLFPDDPGCLLNAQTAATACGFSYDAIETALNEVLEASNQTTIYECLSSGDTTNGLTHFREYYIYNMAWNNIEFQMYDALNADKGKPDNAKVNDIYESIFSQLEQTDKDVPGGDKGIEALLAYIEAVGKQLKLETS